MAVLKVLAESAGHPTVEQIYAQIQADFPTTSLATVHKTLSLLKAAGLTGAHFPLGEACECAIVFGYRNRGFSRLRMLHDTERPAEACIPEIRPQTEIRP